VHVVIMGCGRVGSALARALEERGVSVAVIDRNANAFRRLGADFRGQTVTGIGFDRDTLVAAGIENADAMAAVSSGDNSNVISARVAREQFGVKNVVARIYDPKRAEVYERLGIPTVATVKWTADRVLRAVLQDGATELWRDPTGTIGVVETQPDPAWVGQTVDDLEQASGARIGWVLRYGKGLLPTPSTVLQEGDKVSLLVTDEIEEGALRVVAAGPDGGH
jgi:trk system potassium uptake protein TrkA